MREDWKTIERLFNETVSLVPAERAKVLSRRNLPESVICGVTELLETHDGLAGEFLEDATFPLIAQVIEEDFNKFLKNSAFASYKLLKLLGRGGMGAVFLAEDLRLERIVALKILPRSVFENHASLRRFQQEARAASAIAHQNVAHIYEFGSFEGVYYISMEYVEGETLRELIQRGSLNLLQIVSISRQIAEATAAAHHEHVIHCDIKPENILVTRSRLIKILDFGLAKFGGEKHAKNYPSAELSSGATFGTPAYMSPEQISGLDSNECTDLWSIGVVLYEMLAGARPFDGINNDELHRAILHKNPPALPLFTEIPRFGRIIEKTLAKDINERFRNAGELLLELKSLNREVYDHVIIPPPN